MQVNNHFQSRILRVSNIVIILLILLAFFVMASAQSRAKTISVPADYGSIQEAINHSAKGDTIIVDSGTYTENVVIDRAVTVTGRDTGQGLPVVDGHGNNGITIKVGSVTLQGFQVINANYGIYVICDFQNSVSKNNVIGNTINGNLYGIVAHGYVNIVGNTANNNRASGFSVSASESNVTGNTANNNIDKGFFLSGCLNDYIAGNKADNNGLYGFLVAGPYCNNNLVSGNTAERNQHGIGISECTNVTLTGNTASNNEYAGIYLLSEASNNAVTGNTANNNKYVGICLDNTENVMDNTITGNNVYNNSKGGVCIQPYSSYGFELSGPQYSTDFSRGGNIVRDNNADSPSPVSTPTPGPTPAASAKPAAAGATAENSGHPTAVTGKPDAGSGLPCCPALLIPLLLPGILTISFSHRGKQGRK